MTAAKRHSAEPKLADTLKVEIAALCKQIDARTGAPPGSALRGIYFWLWPATDNHSVEVLTSLHADAVRVLAALTTGPDTTNYHHTIRAALPEYPK